MTDRKAIIIVLPRPVVREELEAMRQYAMRSLAEGILVLPGGSTFRVEDIPALGTVEACALPPQLPEKECAAKAPSPTAREVSPVAKPEAPPSRPTVKWTLPMTAGEIAASYRQASNPLGQIDILAELNACSTDRIREVLAEAGFDVPQKKRGRPKVVVRDG